MILHLREEEKQFQLQILTEMIQILLMLLGLAFGNNNGNATCDNNNGGTVTTQDSGGGTGFDPGDTGGPVGGNSGQLPPPTPRP